MNKIFNRGNVFYVICVLVVIYCLVKRDDSYELQKSYKHQIDSLTYECKQKDTTIDESIRIALDLSQKLDRLYEINPSVHKKIFDETN